MDLKIAFAASDGMAAQQARAELTARYGVWKEASADVIVALGGDGFMLLTLQRTQALGLSVYGMNRGTIGFLMNEFSIETLPQRLALANLCFIQAFEPVRHEIIIGIRSRNSVMHFTSDGGHVLQDSGKRVNRIVQGVHCRA